MRRNNIPLHEEIINDSEGNNLTYTNPSIRTNSYLEWKPNTIYYVKCEDFYGNEPSPNDCSVVVKAVETTQQQS